MNDADKATIREHSGQWVFDEIERLEREKIALQDDYLKYMESAQHLRTNISLLNIQLAEAQRENAELRAAVSEWLCIKCNYVYPGPPQPGVMCLICPRCGGDCGPRLSMELRLVKGKLASVEEKLATYTHRDRMIDELFADAESTNAETGD